jgi:hypothetical protein
MCLIQTTHAIIGIVLADSGPVASGLTADKLIQPPLHALCDAILTLLQIL